MPKIFSLFSIYNRAVEAIKSLTGFTPVQSVPAFAVTSQDFLKGTATIYTKSNVELKVESDTSTVPTHQQRDFSCEPNSFDSLELSFKPNKNEYSSVPMPFSAKIPLENLRSFLVFYDSSKISDYTSSDIINPKAFPDTYFVKTMQKGDNKCSTIDDASSLNGLIADPYNNAFAVFCKLNIWMSIDSPLELLKSIRTISISQYLSNMGHYFTICLIMFQKDVKMIHKIINELYPNSCSFYEERSHGQISLNKPFPMVESITYPINLEQVAEESKIMDKSHIVQLMENVHQRFYQLSLKLVYGTHIHGFSLNSLYRKAYSYEVNDAQCQLPYILVIKDNKDKVFGAFLTHPPQRSKTYYGSGECFVFSFDSQPCTINVYNSVPPTNNNYYYMFGDPQSFYIGSQGTTSTLLIHESMTHGRSQPSPIFSNQPLSSSEYFEINALELWVFN